MTVQGDIAVVIGANRGIGLEVRDLANADGLQRRPSKGGLHSAIVVNNDL